MLIDYQTQYYNAKEYFHEYGKSKDFINSIYEFYDVLNIKLMLDKT